jgi:hypothetical protein
MSKLSAILDAGQHQLTLDGLLAEIEVEETDDGLEPGSSVGHVDYADFRAIYLKPGPRPGQALVKVMAGWHGEYVPTWPVSIPTSKLTEV